MIFNMEIILSIATVLGGIAAAWFIWDKYTHSSNYIEKEKIVNSKWWDSSALKGDLENQGYVFRWSNPDKVEDRLKEGFEIIYEKNLDNNTSDNKLFK